MATPPKPQSPANFPTLSAAGLAALKRQEGTRAVYYNDHPVDGNCTWGTGFKVHNGPCSPSELKVRVTQAEIDSELRRRVARAETTVKNQLHVQLTQQQYDALVSYTFNMGAHGAAEAFRLINHGQNTLAAAEIKRHITANVLLPNGRHVHVKEPGLVTRRQEEAAPFETDAHK